LQTSWIEESKYTRGYRVNNVMIKTIYRELRLHTPGDMGILRILQHSADSYVSQALSKIFLRGQMKRTLSKREVKLFCVIHDCPRWQKRWGYWCSLLYTPLGKERKLNSERVLKKLEEDAAVELLRHKLEGSGR